MIPDNIARLCDLLCCAGSKAERARLSNLRENGQLHRGTERENCFGAGHTPGPTLIEDSMPFFVAKLTIDGQLARLEPYTNPSDAK
jgi:hypothetical protein